MSGRETTRGIFLQALVCLLGTLQDDNEWTSLTLEPDLNSEKVDIAWYYSGSEIKATQVKSSQNQLNEPDAKKWAKKLEDSGEATNYELILIGPCSRTLSKGQRYGNVEVPRPKPLDIQGLIEQSAHQLAVYLEQREKPAGRATTRERVVDSLVGRLQRDSIESTPISRDDFEKLLDEWVQDAFNKEERPSLEQLLKLKENFQNILDEWQYIKSLSEDHSGDAIDHPNAVKWRRAIERHTPQLDKYLPGNDFEKYRANIPWHEPNKRATKDDFNRGCDVTKGFLEAVLEKIQEEIDRMQGETA